MGERLIVTFGRQVYCQILEPLILLPLFCMAVAGFFPPFYFSMNVIHNLGQSEWGCTARDV